MDFFKKNRPLFTPVCLPHCGGEAIRESTAQYYLCDSPSLLLPEDYSANL